MKPAELSGRQELAVVHALLIFAPMLLIPMHTLLSRWPWGLLFCFGVYGGVVLAVRPLRESLHWLRVGRLDRETLLLTGLISLVSVVGLVGWALLVRPDLSVFARNIPSGTGAAWIAAGLHFASVNAAAEEAICRGILMEALETRYGPAQAVALQALIFGAMHANGIPPGLIGIFLSTLYGWMLGRLRQKADGLLACCLAHFVADLTIFLLVTRQG
jgi:uncharacterized protein